MTKRYLDLSQSFPIIIFPRYINTLTFEHILKECYLQTLQKGKKVIGFNFNAVLWCDVFSLSLLCLWVLELKDKAKRMVFYAPNDATVKGFFIRYGFDKFLQSNGISWENAESLGNSRDIPQPFYSPYCPLTFFDQDSFRKTLEDWQYSNRLEMVLHDIKEKEIVQSGTILEIVLRELGDNIFFHGESRFGHFIMTKVESKGGDSASWGKIQYELASDLEKSFFLSLYGHPFLMIVIGDKGPGIYQTLRKAYDNDTIIEDKLENPSEKDIAEYAFLYHSSRRPVIERVGSITRVLSTEAEEFPPPTGLYRLKEITRKFRGFLYVRTGGSVICFDFYTNPNQEYAVSNKSSKEVRNLANFGGTQYRIYFPLDVEKGSSIHHYRSESERSIDFSLKYDCLSLSRYFKSASANPTELQESHELEASQLEKVFAEIEKIKLRKLKTKHSARALVLDFQDTVLSQKAYHYLILEAMRRVTPSHINLCVNVPHGTIDQYKTLEKEAISLFERPLLLFDSDFVPNLLGIKADEKQLFVDLMNGRGEPETAARFARKYPLYFRLNESNRKYEFIHSRLHLMRAVKDTIRTDLHHAMVSPASKIFHKDIKVLIPSGSYSEGYFETYKLSSREEWHRSLVRWLEYWIIELQPSCIVSISSQCGQMVETSLKNINKSLTGGSTIKHLNLRTPVKEVAYIELVLELDPNQRTIIFTDVIGTSDTIKNVLEKMQHTNVLKIFTLVNARQDERDNIEFKGKSFDIESVVRQKLDYHNNLPPGWLYSEIYQVDPDTHILITNIAKPEGPMWKGLDRQISSSKSGEQIEILRNEFFTDVIIPSESVIEGHFSAGDKHMTYLFNIPKICGSFGQEIASVIVDCVKEKLPIVKRRSISHIFYPTFNPGLDSLAEQISRALPKSAIVGIKRDEFMSRYDQIEKSDDMDAVVVIDDAFVSGDTIFRMFDICARKGAKHIFAFVLIKRGSEYHARRLEDITKYGGASIQTRYLSDAEIPSYGLVNCPVCIEINHIAEVAARKHIGRPFMQFLQNENATLMCRDVGTVIGDLLISQSANVSCPGNKLCYRWKLELARTQPGIRKELANVVREFREHPQEVVAFFMVLAKEKSVFLADTKVKGQIFYDTFVQDIIGACRHFCELIDTFSYEEVNAIISVLRGFSEDYFVDNLLTLSRKSIISEKHFFTVMLHCMQSSKCHEYPGRIKGVLTDLTDVQGIAPDILITIDGLLLYWGQQDRAFQDTRNEKIDCYNNLNGGIFHSLRHFKQSIEKSNEIDFICDNWTKLSDDMKSMVLPCLRTFIRAHVSLERVLKLHNRISELEYHILEGSKLALLLRSGQTEPTPIIERIGQITSTIYRIVYDKTEGLLQTLEGFRTDIKEVLVRVLDQQDNDLSMKGITISTDIPQRDLLVFGERISIAEIFQNIIENVWKHADANTLKIAINTDSSPDPYGLEYLDIFFMDNGKGIGDLRRIGAMYGLKKVQENILSCCGDFFMYWQGGNGYYKMQDLVSSELLETDQHYQAIHRTFLDNFRTIVHTRLIYLKRKGE